MAPCRVTFRGWTCRVERASYGRTNRIALPLYDAANDEPVAVATVNMPELSLAADEVVIKDYSENEGILALLVTAGVISPPLRAVQGRYGTLYVCRCLI